MRFFHLFLSLLFCMIALLADAQAYYRFTYQSPVTPDSLTEDAMLIIYENGTGLARIKRPDGLLYEMRLSEQFAFKPAGSIDNRISIYEGGAPLSISGVTREIKPISFWFKLNTMSDHADPWLVAKDAKDSMAGNPFLSIELLDNTRLSDASFVLNYFTKKDPFFQNRFGPKPRGLLTPEEKKTRLIVLVVAQTYDKKIGPGTLVDARNVFNRFSDVAAFLGIKPVFDSVYGDRYNRTNILQAINKLKPTSRDIVVFWYSGHGFTEMNSTNRARRAMKYSFMDMLDPRQKPRPNPRDSALNIETVYDLVRKKGGRLNLVIGDCCNDEIIPKKKDTIPPSPKPKGPIPKWNWNNVYALFMKPRQSMMITAASQGQQAYADTVKGSVFTNFFLGSLAESLSPDVSSPDWKKIWKTAQLNTIERIRKARIVCPLPFQPKNVCQQIPPEPKIN